MEDLPPGMESMVPPPPPRHQIPPPPPRPANNNNIIDPSQATDSNPPSSSSDPNEISENNRGGDGSEVTGPPGSEENAASADTPVDVTPKSAFAGDDPYAAKLAGYAAIQNAYSTNPQYQTFYKQQFHFQGPSTEAEPTYKPYTSYKRKAADPAPPPTDPGDDDDIIPSTILATELPPQEEEDTGSGITAEYVAKRLTREESTEPKPVPEEIDDKAFAQYAASMGLPYQQDEEEEEEQPKKKKYQKKLQYLFEDQTQKTQPSQHQQHRAEPVNNGVGVASFARRTFSVESSREKEAARLAKLEGKKKESTTTSAASAPAGASGGSSVLASIKDKLAGKNKGQQGKYRDPELMATIAEPTYVSHRVGSGLTSAEVAKAQEEHSRKLMGWKYHVAAKARDEQNLQNKRQKNKE